MAAGQAPRFNAASITLTSASVSLACGWADPRRWAGGALIRACTDIMLRMMGGIMRKVNGEEQG